MHTLLARIVDTFFFFFFCMHAKPKPSHTATEMHFSVSDRISVGFLKGLEGVVFQ